MERYILNDLIKWKESESRKPLILKGARQVGKTYILKYFGEKYYEGVAYFNFDHDEDLFNLFTNTKDPKRILEQLAFIYGKAIIPGKTLIIFDEVQECPNALNSLKYFNEEANEYHIICAGSLLGVKLSHTSFPVGKVEFLNMYPMTFTEFLVADNASNLVDYMNSILDIGEIPDIFANQLEEKLKAYFIIGGMPEVVFSWVTEKNMERVNAIQSNILTSYESDFSKHSTASEATKISYIWNSIPSQLAKENKKFLYQTVKEGARAREYENALNWLKDAGLIYKIYNVKEAKFPLKAYTDLSAFKIYIIDVGLLRNMANLDSRIIIEGNRLFEEFKGAFTENYILSTLSYVYKNDPYYHTFDRYEIDFMIQSKNAIVPVEVKSGISVNSTSLKNYTQRYDPSLAVKFSLKNFRKDDKVLNIPLYLAEYINKFI